MQSVTNNYRTKSMIIPMEMPKILGNNQFKGTTIAAIDGGYSAVKGIGPTKGFIFPSYAKKLKNDMQIIGEMDDTAILLRDHKTNTLWAVGDLAQKMMEKKDVDATTDQYLFDRYRYQTDIFRIIMTAGLGICLLGTLPSNAVKIQTGLPSTYKNEDANELKSVLSGTYDFDLKIGNADFIHLTADITQQDIDIIEQPQGTLLSCVYDKNGKPVENYRSFMKSSTIIYDIGFNTEDIFVIENGIVQGHQTYLDTGMKAVFDETLSKINKDHKTTFKIFEFQKFLENGKVVYFDRNTYGSKIVDFSEILLAANENACLKSVNRLMQEYDYLSRYENLVITGGTGESRFTKIQSILAGVRNDKGELLNVLPGNLNDPQLPFSFSNVRGYYMYCYMKCKREMTSDHA